MGAAVSSVADAARTAKNYRQPRLIAPNDAATDHDEDEYDYWSALPDDLLFTIMAELDVPNLRRSGAVCTSWRHAHNAFNLAALEKAPCLLYACEEYGPNDVALYCPTTDATLRVPFPGQPHYKRGFTFSCPGGWVFTTDEVGDPYLINPLTGVKAKLPPVKTTYHNDDYDDDGKYVWDADPEDGNLPIITWARHMVYLRVAISAATEVTECTVLILHMPEWGLSFARPGDTRWTLLTEDTHFVSDILYNEKDGLFYILYRNGSVFTLDLRGTSPSTTMIMDKVIHSGRFRNMYLAHGPSGELLQIWRYWDRINTPVKLGGTYKDMVKEILEDCAELAGEANNEGKLSELDTNDEVGEVYEAATADQEIDASLILREVIDLPHRLVDEVTTIELLVFKVDIKRQKLVELRDIDDHALFLGLNSVVCLPTKDFPVFEPNCAYLADDCFDHTPMLRNDLGVWNIKKRRMQKLRDAWPNIHSWLHLPAPIWIMPRF